MANTKTQIEIILVSSTSMLVIVHNAGHEHKQLFIRYIYVGEDICGQYIYAQPG